MLLCMDEKTTGDLFNHLNDDEIRRVGGALLRLNQIPAVQIQGVIDEFHKQVDKKQTQTVPEPEMADISVDGKKVVEKVMTRALPRTRGQNILTSMRSIATPSAKDQRNFGQMVGDFEPDLLYDFLKDEHPQVVAITLSYAKRKTAKGALEKFSPEVQTDLLHRMARLDKISGQILEELTKFVAQKIADRERSRKSGEPVQETAQAEAKQDQSLEGLGVALKILKSIQRDKAAKIIEEIEKTDKALADAINKQMFTVEDLERADDTGIRELLRNVKNEDLKVALKNAPDPVKNKFFSNMSERAASILREDMEVMPPLKVEDIEKAQENILSASRKLMKDEKLRLTEIPDEEG